MESACNVIKDSITKIPYVILALLNVKYVMMRKTVTSAAQVTCGQFNSRFTHMIALSVVTTVRLANSSTTCALNANPACDFLTLDA